MIEENKQVAHVDSENPWGTHLLESGHTESIRVGPLRMDLRRDHDELWVAWSRSVDEAAPTEPTQWERWAAPRDASTIVVTPALPARTLVVAPEMAFHVMPGARARVYIRVPLVAQISIADPLAPPLLEVPSVVMSNTWWGDFVDGELCFSLPTTARKALQDQHFKSHLVVCPVHIENESNELLRIEGSALRVAHLSIFSDANRLWADETHVRYSGHEQGSEIDMSGQPPTEAPEAALIASPRQPLDRGLRARTFERLRSLSGL